MLIHKKGKVVDIPIRQKTIVRLREGRNGTLTNRRAFVMGLAPADDFTRAYGREAYVCILDKKGREYGGVHVVRKTANDLYPVGRAKRVPASCREALKEYERSYPTLARKRRR